MSKATRAKTPDELVRDKALALYQCSTETTSPVERKYPPGFVSTLAAACGCNRMRITRWLKDPNRYSLSWNELQAIAAEAGGTVRIIFSVKCQ